MTKSIQDVRKLRAYVQVEMKINPKATYQEIAKKASNDIIDIVKCFLGKEELITDVKDIIEIIKSGDYSKLITIALKVYADVSNAVKDCVPQEETQLTVKFREQNKF